MSARRHKIPTKPTPASDRRRGNPFAFMQTPGQGEDCPQAMPLFGAVEPDDIEAVLSNRGYDSDALVAYIEAMEADAEIPSRKNREAPREHDKYLYK